MRPSRFRRCNTLRVPSPGGMDPATVKLGCSRRGVRGDVSEFYRAVRIVSHPRNGGTHYSMKKQNHKRKKSYSAKLRLPCSPSPTALAVLTEQKDLWLSSNQVTGKKQRMREYFFRALVPVCMCPTHGTTSTEIRYRETLSNQLPYVPTFFLSPIPCTSNAGIARIAQQPAIAVRPRVLSQR